MKGTQAEPANTSIEDPGHHDIPLLSSLLFWEQQWFFVFHGLALGADSWKAGRPVSPTPPIQPSERGQPELDRERFKDWREREQKYWKQQKSNKDFSRQYYSVNGTPPETNVWQRLIDSKTPLQVRRACKASKHWLNPQWRGRAFVSKLYEHADEFLIAKSDPRFPQSRRPTSELKRIAYLAQAMAGIEMRKSPITSIDLLRKQPHRDCHCWKCYRREEER